MRFGRSGKACGAWAWWRRCARWAAGWPDQIHLLPPPPYSPEINPVEGLWEQVQDVTCNHRHVSLDTLEETLTAALRPFWESPAKVLSLIHHRLHGQASVAPGLIVPITCEKWYDV